MIRNLLISLVLLSCTLSTTSFAKTLKLYEEPKDQAKVVGSLDSETGIITIFTPEKGDWIKVADPRNGNVGWIKANDLGDSGSTEYSFTQRFISTGNTPQSYQIIQFGAPKKMTPQEIRTLLKKNKEQQEDMQKKMNKMVEDMNKLYQMNNPWFNNSMPLMMPVIIVPTPTPPLDLQKTKP